MDGRVRRIQALRRFSEKTAARPQGSGDPSPSQPHAAPGRLSGQEAEDDDDLDASLSGHHAHFLERSLRFSSQELTRAMRMYQHPEIVRRLLGQHMTGESDRAAIALGEPPTGHVVLTRKGDFVSCLSAKMHLKGVQVLPYSLFLPPMDAEDGKRADMTVQRDQLARLLPADLIYALASGPGFLTQEMVEVLDRRPQTYVLPVLMVQRRIAEVIVSVTKARDGLIDLYWITGEIDVASWDRMVQGRIHVDACLTLCIYLLAIIRTPETRGVLQKLSHVVGRGPMGAGVLFSLARHPDGFELLMTTAYDPLLEPGVRGMAVLALRGHGHRYPRNLPRFAPRLLNSPPANLNSLPKNLPLVTQENIFPFHPDVLSLTEDQCQVIGDQAYEQYRNSMQTPKPESGWIFDVGHHLEMDMNRVPVSRMFPPKAMAEEVQTVWKNWVQNIHVPPPKRPAVKQRRNLDTKVGRNDPCPCKSGKKYKQCCLSAQEATRQASQAE